MASSAEPRPAADGEPPRAELADFAAGYPFGLDPFQLEACRALAEGFGVLVAAPTGAGKTVVGEFAVHLALAAGRKCFYTTPIKALSNQKYLDLVARHGERAVGLLTGDNAINGDAPVVVMTTEVLRNMLYAGSPALRGLGYVVMDEVHYLADRFRGAVWEEVIIHLPAEVRLVSLSATVSNAEEFGDWLVTVRGDTRVVVEEHRPVPLWQHVMVGSRLVDLFAGGEVNPELLRLAREEIRFSRLTGGRPVRGRQRPRRFPTPGRVAVIERLDSAALLPAITFVFSRAGCEAAAAQCRRAGLRLNTPQERAAVRSLVAERTRELAEEDLAALGYWDWLDGLERGVAAHHAGLLPTFKEVVEVLFAAGLVKAVFATETLALGINMPARSVVLERLVKWNGEAHVDLTAGEYTQLTGRAGRRGIDVEGHAVVLWTPDLDPAHLAGLASTRTYPLRSSFRPSYNMAVNLVGWVGRDRARQLLESSFAQFQADRSVVGPASQLLRNRELLEELAAGVHCHLGDLRGYLELRRELTGRESRRAAEAAASRRAESLAALQGLRPGDVVAVPVGRRAGLAVVLDPGLTEDPLAPRPLVLTLDRRVRRLSSRDFPVPVTPLARVRVPRTFSARSARARRDLASALRSSGASPPPPSRPAARRPAADPQLRRLRAAVAAHPCHGCPEREEHMALAERHDRLAAETEALSRRVAGRTGTIARTFDRVCAVLERLGYLDGDRVTPAGATLGRIYAEADLVVAECLRAGTLVDLPPPTLAAALSALVYESRDGPPAAPPPAGARAALTQVARRWAELRELEAEHGLHFLPEPDPGLAAAAAGWVRGDSLAEVLEDTGLAAGDLVRWLRQLLDLLDQVVAVADPAVAVAARAAVSGLRRGVVAQPPPA